MGNVNQNIPFLGAGISWIEDNEYKEFVEKELDPQTTFIEVHLPTPTELLPDKFQKVAHCSSLGLADQNFPSKILEKQVFDQANKIGAKWLGEHLSVMGTSSGVQFGYIFPPIEDETLSQRLKERLSYYDKNYNTPIILEMGPRYWTTENSTPIDDYNLLSSLAKETNTPIIFDIPHCVASFDSNPEEVYKVISLLKDVNVLELHMGAGGLKTNEKINQWDILDICLKEFDSVRGVTMELGKDTNLNDYCNNVRDLTKKLEGHRITN